MFGCFAQRFYSTESPELLQKISATAKQYKDYAGFLTTVGVIGGGAIELTRMTKDQMKEVVKPIEEKVDKNSVEIKSVNQKLEKMEDQFCQFSENIRYIKAKLDNNSKK